MSWRVIPYTVNDPARNMAIDEAIFFTYLKGLAPPTLRFYGWEPPTVSIGYFQDVEREINLSNILAKGYGLVRRPTGGRAVLHHHELTYAVIAGVKDGLPDNLIQSYFYISRALTAAFEHFGLTAELHQAAASKNITTGACFESPSWYELKVGNRKLVGSAQVRRERSLLQHGSILLDFFAADLGAVLRIPETESINAFIERLNQKVNSLKGLGVLVQPQELARVITDSFQGLYQYEFIESFLTEAEEELVNELVVTKYSNPDWNLTRGRLVPKTGNNGFEE